MSESQVSACYFLEPDLRALDLEIDRVRALIRETKEASQEGTEQSSESWHDNYIFEEAQRTLKMLLNHLGGLSKARERAVVVQPPADPDTVQVGVTVSFVAENENRKDSFSIGSYMVFDQLRDLDFISYDAPLAAILLGASVGDVCTGTIGSQEQSLRVTQILSAAPILDAICPE